MKKISVITLSFVFVVSFAHSQSMKEMMEKSREAKKSLGISTASDSGSSKQTSTTSNEKVCKSDEQKSLPLNFLSTLIMDNDESFDVNVDPSTGILTITAKKFISNCSDMLQWNLNRSNTKPEKYSVEVSFRKDSACEKICDYKVEFGEKGEFKKSAVMQFAPNFEGFKECLEKSGAYKDGVPSVDGVYTPNLKKSLSLKKNPKDADYESGVLLFKSTGKISATIGSRYGKEMTVDGCDHYEDILPTPKKILSYEEEKKNEIKDEFLRVKECKDYTIMSEFMEKFADYADQMAEVRDNLLKAKAKAATADVVSGNYKESDLKVLEDLDQLIVRPKIVLAGTAYQEWEEAEGDEEKEAALAKLNNVKKELANLQEYFSKPQTDKLLSLGKIDDAKYFNEVAIYLDNYSQLGPNQGRKTITLDEAQANVVINRAKFADFAERKREEYGVRTGQITGQSEYYGQLATSTMTNVNKILQDLALQMQELEAQKSRCQMQYWRTQQCLIQIAEAQQQIVADMEYYRKAGSEKVAYYDKRSKQYGALEAEGRKFASQNGERVPEDPTTIAPPPGRYIFDYNQQAQIPNGQQMAMNPLMMLNQLYQNPFQQNYNPYQYWPGQMGMMGGNGNAYNFGWNPQMPQGLYGQGPYGQQPYGQMPFGQFPFGQQPYMQNPLAMPPQYTFYR